ncbi:hypothetical protein QQ045_031474 [Rhodiola kirilowii]
MAAQQQPENRTSSTDGATDGRTGKYESGDQRRNPKIRRTDVTDGRTTARNNGGRSKTAENIDTGLRLLFSSRSSNQSVNPSISDMDLQQDKQLVG